MWNSTLDLRLRRLTDALCLGTISPEQEAALDQYRILLLEAQQHSLPPLDGGNRETRTHIRAALGFECELECEDGSRFGGRTMDIGTGGMGIFINGPTRTRDPKYVTVRSTDSDSVALVVTVQLCWQVRQADGWRLGLSYRSVSQPLHMLLTRMVLNAASNELLRDQPTPRENDTN